MRTVGEGSATAFPVLPDAKASTLFVVGDAAAGAAAVATSATAVAACAACCALPLALSALAVGVGGAALAWLEAASGWMTGISIMVVAAAWLMLSRRGGSRPARSTLLMLTIASLLTAAALLWSLVHGH